MRLAVLAALHIFGVLFLFAIGIYLNDEILSLTNRYSGVVTVFSMAFGTYSVVANYLYQTNAEVHLFVNRLFSLFRRAHTRWMPAFDFTIPSDRVRAFDEILGDVTNALLPISSGSVRCTNQTSQSATISVDDKWYFSVRLNEDHLFMSFDRRVLVPNHLYDKYTSTLARMAEALKHAMSPAEMRLSLQITFDDGVSNPYFGFLVRQIPSHALRHFEASFEFGHGRSCRVEVGKSGVDVEGHSVVDFFAAVSQVLALRAFPTEST